MTNFICSLYAARTNLSFILATYMFFKLTYMFFKNCSKTTFSDNIKSSTKVSLHFSLYIVLILTNFPTLSKFLETDKPYQK